MNGQGREPVAIVGMSEPERVLRFGADGTEELLARLDRPDTELLAGVPDETGECRLAVVGPTPQRLAVARKIVARALKDGKPWLGRNDIWFSARPLLRAEPDAKTAFVFPGLEADFAPRCADVAAHFGLPDPATGVSDVDTLLGHADGVTAVGRLLDAALRELGLRPDGLAGHSVGEWTAMIAAGMYATEEVHRLRGRCWPDGFTPPEAEFVVLGCSAAEALKRIENEPRLVLSHDNAPRQSIVCGQPEAAERLVRACREDGVVAKILPFRSGFHTPLMWPRLGPFAKMVGELPLWPPAAPVWSATTVGEYPAGPDEIRALYLEHLVAPVRFRELVEAMYANGFRLFVQAGPGQLGSFISDTLAGRPHLVISADSPLRDGMAQLRRVAAAMWVEGASPRFDRLETAGENTESGKAHEPVVGTEAEPLPVSSPVRGLLDRHPLPEVPPGVSAEVVEEFTALLAETREAAASVLAAASRPAGTRESVLSVSMAELPYLADHRFFRQREDWPDEVDRRPVVPATTLIAFAVAEVERAWPGRVTVAVHHARFDRWLVAAPAQRVPVRLRALENGRVAVEIGGYASMTVELADRYPAAPAVSLRPVEPETEPPLPAGEIYRRREMFHGEAYRGLTVLSGLGERHIRGEITVPPAPGGLLDNIGQLLGCWLMATQTEYLLAFPRSIKKISFYGPHPEPGERVRSLAAISAGEPETLRMSASVVHHGRTWAEIEGWQDIRFACDRAAHRVYAFPDRHLLARRRADGWYELRDRWPGAATRDIYAGVFLSSAEREEYARRPLSEQSGWLLDRIVVKDAVRAWLAGRGVTGVFPAEIGVIRDHAGRIRVAGRHGRELPELSVTLAHNEETAAAMVRQELLPTTVERENERTDRRTDHRNGHVFAGGGPAD